MFLGEREIISWYREMRTAYPEVYGWTNGPFGRLGKQLSAGATLRLKEDTDGRWHGPLMVVKGSRWGDSAGDKAPMYVTEDGTEVDFEAVHNDELYYVETDVGRFARLRNLDRQELNGLVGRIAGWDSLTGRYRVEVPGRSRVLGVKAANFRFVRRRNLSSLPERVLVEICEYLPFSQLDDVRLFSKAGRQAVDEAWDTPPKLRAVIAEKLTSLDFSTLVAAVRAHDAALVRAALQTRLVTLDDHVLPGRQSLLHVASSTSVAVLTLLVDEYRDDVNKRSGDGSTPLILACMKPQADCAKFLLERKANPYYVDDDGDGPLYYAYDLGAKGHACVNVLRDFGVRGNPGSPVHTSSGSLTGFGDVLPRDLRYRVANGIEWRPEWD